MDDDPDVDDAADTAVERALTETAKPPSKVATGKKRKGNSSKVLYAFCRPIRPHACHRRHLDSILHSQRFHLSIWIRSSACT